MLTSRHRSRSFRLRSTVASAALILAATAVSTALPATSAHAVPVERAAILFPFSDGVKSWAGGHGPAARSAVGATAQDLYAPEGTEVRARFKSGDGVISLSVASVQTLNCTPKAGKSVSINVSVDGTPVGQVAYQYLDAVPAAIKAGAAIPVGQLLGELRDWSSGSCQSAVKGLAHTSTRTTKGCYRDLPADTSQRGGVAVGMLKSTYDDANTSTCDESELTQMMSAASAVTNPIAEENKKKKGTTQFVIPGMSKLKLGEKVARAQSALTSFTQPTINGYASATSINKGESIDLHVSTTAATYRIDVYRMGWYGGAGSTLKQSITDLVGQFQATPTPNPTTGLIDADWPVSHTLETDSGWVTGVYLAKLVPNSGTSGYIMFVVRDDGAPADVLFQIPVTTYQAYNYWGGKSLYDGDDGVRAFKVSFNRPYLSFNGAGRFFAGDYNMIRFLESEGYNVTYATSVDTHTRADLIDGREMFLSNWHDEYWSKPMRDNLTSWRDDGKDLAFFDSNNIYWQIRFESDAAGNPNRIQVCYKPGSGGIGVDPITSTNPGLTTGQWRQNPVNKPENALLGGMYEDNYPEENPYPWVVVNSSHWVYANTGVSNGDSIPDVVGNEYDRIWNNGLTPVGTIALSHSPVISPSFGPSIHNGTIYTAPSGALVFNAGTNMWSWKLDDNATQSHGADSRIQQMTRNILDGMIGSPPAVSEPRLCPCNVWSSTTPQNTSSTDTRAVELGVKFRTLTAGAVKGIRFYKGAGNTGTHIGNLWSSSGTLLARATFTSESSSGWQSVTFAAPVPVAANTTYVASYFAPNGHYPYNTSYFASAAAPRGPLLALKNGTDGSNGLFKYDSSTTFPNGSYSSTNYWVDVVFDTSGYGVWTSSTSIPDNTTGAGSTSVELGMKFSSTLPGVVKGVRFYKGTANTGTHTGALWEADGTKLAQVTFQAESASGWQTAYFSSPVSINAGTIYVISYHAPVGKYAYNTNFFGSTAGNGGLTGLTSGASGGNGVYGYGSGVLFPNQTYNASNYWVDVIFSITPS